jgi:hypothetical protein
MDSFGWQAGGQNGIFDPFRTSASLEVAIAKPVFVPIKVLIGPIRYGTLNARAEMLRWNFLGAFAAVWQAAALQNFPNRLSRNGCLCRGETTVP